LGEDSLRTTAKERERERKSAAWMLATHPPCKGAGRGEGPDLLVDLFDLGD
jgi:hypothetical protein